MSAKLDAGMYKDRFAFEADFALMISNAKQYNVAGSYAHNEAIAMETLFEKRERTCIRSRYKLIVWLQIGRALIKHWK